MIYWIWFIFLGLGLIFFFLSFKFKNEYPDECHLLMLFGAFFMLMSGLFVLGEGVEFPNFSTSIVETGMNSYSIVKDSDSISGGFSSYGLSWAIIFLSFGMFLITSLSWLEYKNSKKVRSYSEEED